FGTGSKWWGIAVAGLVAGAALAPLAAAIGSAGTGLLALFVLPPLGFVAAALPRGRTVLFALAALGPLALVDPDELTLILGLRDEPFWAFVAAAGSLAVGLLISLWYALAGAPRRRFAAIAAAVAIAAAATVHIG